MAASWYVRSSDGKVYGPADDATLLSWVKDGRLEPTGHVSQDRVSWVPPQLLPQLEMKWIVEVAPGKTYGPFNRELVKRLASEGSIPEGAKVYRLYELPVDRDPEPVVVEKIVEREVPVEKIVEKVVIREVPVERIVEKIVEREVPVEKIVEKVVEKVVVKEVPVEKVVEKIVEVPPSARTTVVVPEVVEVADAAPPRRIASGIFKDVDPASLAALESAARRELSAAKRHGFGFFGGRR